MKHFLWIVPHRFLSDAKTFSFEIVVPKNYMKVDCATLPGSKVWIASAIGKKALIFANLVVKDVEIFVESGIRDGDFLLVGDVRHSTWVLPKTGNDNIRWKIDPFPEKANDGLCRIDGEVSERLERTLRENIPLRTSIPDSVLDKFPEATLFRNKISHMTEQWLALHRTIPYANSFKYYKHPARWSPYTSMTLLQTLRSNPDWKEEEIRNILDDLESQDFGQGEIAGLTLADLDFREIVPEHIRARRYAARAQPLDKMETIVQKTEISEARHQTILKSTVEYLLKLGYTPMESRSVDLAVVGPKGWIILEIKSSNPDNLLRQGESGFMQALRYEIAVRRNGGELAGTGVIIENTENTSEFEYLKLLGERIGLKALIYDGAKDWPNRVYGLHDFIENAQV